MYCSNSNHRVVLILLTGLLLAGCSTTATIYMKDEYTREVKITGSDSNSIFIEKGLILQIPREKIEYIDHPGNVEAIVGGSLVAAGVGGFILIFSPTTNQGIEEGAAYLFGGLFSWSIIVGAPMGIWGLITWLTSYSRAVPPDESEGPKVSPVTVMDGKRTYYGIGLSWNW